MPLRDSLAMLPTLTARPDHNLATLRRLVFAGDTAPTALAMPPRVHACKRFALPLGTFAKASG